MKNSWVLKNSRNLLSNEHKIFFVLLKNGWEKEGQRYQPPKKRINTINNLSDEDTLLVGKMIQVAKDLAKKYEIDESGYRLIFNTNDDGGQTVYHIHLHLIGGEKLKAF